MVACDFCGSVIDGRPSLPGWVVVCCGAPACNAEYCAQEDAANAAPAGPRNFLDLARAWGEERPWLDLPTVEQHRWWDLCEREQRIEDALRDLDADTRAAVLAAADGINDLDDALTAQERALDEVQS